MTPRLIRLLFVVAVVALRPLGAAALPFVQLEIATPGGEPVVLTDADLSCGGAGSNQFCATQAPLSDPRGVWTLHGASLLLDPDPSVTNVVALTNVSSTTTPFTITVTLPISPAFGPPSLIQGSMGGSLTDSNGDGSALLDTITATAIYTALIDGTGVRTLLDPGDPNLPVAVSTTFGTATLGPAGFGLSGFESVPVATTSTIGIALNFTLTPGDSASLTSVFNVIPEPSAGLLLATGLTLLGLGRRRPAARPIA